MKNFLHKNWLESILFILTYLSFFVLFFVTLPYSRLNYIIYFFGFGFMMLMIFLFGVLLFEGIHERKKTFRTTGIIGLSLFLIALNYGNYLIIRVNSSINKVIVSDSENSVLNLAFVTYDNPSILTEVDMSDKVLGILSNSEGSDRNSYVKSEIEKLHLNIQYKEYLSYNDALLGLFAGEIDVVVMPQDYYSQFEGNEGYSDYLDRTNIIYSFSATISSSNITSDIDVAKEPFSILIMGNDGGRTDSLILATYNPIKLSVTMTSIPRDSFVPIACYPNQQKDKIGHAFAVSRDCAINTVENLLSVDINYYVEVNFQGVVEIVDALDRVWLNSPLEFVGQNSSDERGHFTVWIPEGGFWATGEQALAFARERHQMPGGDYQRQENQQQVIKAIIDRTLQLNDVNKALMVLDAAGNNVKTNIPLDKMIEIFNTLLNAVNRTNIEPAYIMDIIGSRIMGYSSYTYNDTLQLPLWIMVPYQGSIQDMNALVEWNLKLNTSLPTLIEPKFDAAHIFYQEDYFAKTYDEKEVHEKLPDFMPQIANNNWTYADVLKWAKERNISIKVEEIREGNSLYNANVVHNYIVGQSVRYGIKTSTFNTLSVKVIKHQLNCKLEENMVYDECRYLLPNFVEDQTKLKDVVTWATENNVVLSYIKILETDPMYDKTKIGYVIKQDPSSWSDIRTMEKLTLTIMDPNFSLLLPDTTNWTETVARQWVKDNLSDELNIEVTYIPTIDPTQFGKVASTNPVMNNKIKINDILKVNIYAEGFILGNQVGKTKDELISTLCTKLVCAFVDVSTTNTSLIGKIASQDVTADTLKTISKWLESTVTFGVYKAASITPSTP